MNARDNGVERERDELLTQLAELLEGPMVVLGAAWLVLLIVEFTRGLSPLLERAGDAIWVLFVADFLLRFLIAPRKIAFLKRNWLPALSLALPALRLFRALRGWRAVAALRASRGTRLFRLVATLNRGMRALSATFARRGFGYVIALTASVTLAGAAGMLTFERGIAGSRIEQYSDALWWTAMIMTTMGSEYWPQTPEGRILCVLLSLYAFAVFGYVTATLASFFVDRDAHRPDAAVAGAPAIDALARELRELRAEVRQLAPGRGE
jgi:voltage-gated potassium channel